MADPSRTDVAVPDGAWAGAVLLHPHPAYGGDRHNVVVDALWRAFTAGGVAAVRFDFASEEVADGVAEASEALDLLPPDVPLVVAGYSFGAVVGSRVDDERVAGWALVAPPFGRMLPGSAASIAPDPRPKLVLVPAHDQFCQPRAAREEVGDWKAVELEEVASADHFLAGATASVAERILRWVSSLGGR